MSRIIFVLTAGLFLSSAAFAQIAPLYSEVIQMPRMNQNDKVQTEDYEHVINDYTKYLASVSKAVKEEEMQHLAEMSKIDKEIAKLRHKKAVLNSKLSEAVRNHQNTKMMFEQKLSSLSKFNKYSGDKVLKNYKKNKRNTETLKTSEE
jgi:hypothetical protein